MDSFSGEETLLTCEICRKQFPISSMVRYIVEIDDGDSLGFTLCKECEKREGSAFVLKIGGELVAKLKPPKPVTLPVIPPSLLKSINCEVCGKKEATVVYTHVKPLDNVFETAPLVSTDSVHTLVELAEKSVIQFHMCKNCFVKEAGFVIDDMDDVRELKHVNSKDGQASEEHPKIPKTDKSKEQSAEFVTTGFNDKRPEGKKECVASANVKLKNISSAVRDGCSDKDLLSLLWDWIQQNPGDPREKILGPLILRYCFGTVDKSIASAKFQKTVEELVRYRYNPGKKMTNKEWKKLIDSSVRGEMKFFLTWSAIYEGFKSLSMSPESSLNDFERALRYDPKNNVANYFANYYMGMIYLQDLEDLDNALIYFREAMQLKPPEINFPYIYFFLGAVLSFKGAFQEAQQYFEKTIEEFEKTEDEPEYYEMRLGCHEMLARIALSEGQVESAEEHWRKVLELSKEKPRVLGYEGYKEIEIAINSLELDMSIFKFADASNLKEDVFSIINKIRMFYLWRLVKKYINSNYSEVEMTEVLIAKVQCLLCLFALAGRMKEQEYKKMAEGIIRKVYSEEELDGLGEETWDLTLATRIFRSKGYTKHVQAAEKLRQIIYLAKGLGVKLEAALDNEQISKKAIAEAGSQQPIAFSEETIAELKEYMSGLVYPLHKDLQELKGTAKGIPEEVRRSYEKSVEEKVLPGLKEIKFLVKEGKKEKIRKERTEINFEKGQVRIGSKIYRRYQQPFELLEYFINKKEDVHWIEGLRIFDEWRNVRKDIGKLKSVFGVVVSKLKGPDGIFRKNELNLNISGPEKGFYKLEGLENCVPNIITVNSLYEEALSLYERNLLEDAKNRIAKGLEVYAEHIPFCCLLVRILPAVKMQTSLVMNAKRVMQKEMTILEKVIETVKHYMNQMEKGKKEWKKLWGDETDREEFESEIEIFRSTLESEFADLKEHFENSKRWLSGNSILFDSDTEYDEVKSLIKDQNFNELAKKGAVKYVLAQIARRLEGMKYRPLRSLIHEQEKASLRKNAMEEFDERRNEEAKTILAEILLDPEKSKRIDFSKAPTLESLKGYLIKIAYWEIQKQLSVSELTEKEKRHLREFRKFKEELTKNLGRELTLGECFDAFKAEKKLGDDYYNYLIALMQKEAKLPLLEEQYKEKEEHENLIEDSEH